MSQPENVHIPAFQEPAPTPSAPKSLVNEDTIFDGSPSWMGRFKAFFFTWILALLAVVVPIALQIGGTQVAWWVIAMGILLALALVLGQFLFHRTLRYRITNYRIDFERGLFTRRIDSLELWHADDLNFTQTLIERTMGVGTIEVVAHDQSSPRLSLKSISNAREIFEKLKTSVLNAKRQRGLLQLDQ